MAVDEGGENVMSDEICRRNNGMQERSRRGGRSVQLPDLVMNKIKSNILLLLPGHQNEASFVGGISERRPESEPFVFIRVFRIRGPYIFYVRREGGREGGRKVLNEEARVAASCQKIK